MSDTWKLWLKVIGVSMAVAIVVTGGYTIWMIHVITEALEGLTENVEITLPETLEEHGMLKEIE